MGGSSVFFGVISPLAGLYAAALAAQVASLAIMSTQALVCRMKRLPDKSLPSREVRRHAEITAKAHVSWLSRPDDDVDVGPCHVFLASFRFYGEDLHGQMWQVTVTQRKIPLKIWNKVETDISQLLSCMTRPISGSVAWSASSMRISTGKN